MRDVTVELKALRLHGMASAWCDLAEQGAASGLDASRWLVELLLQAAYTHADKAATITNAPRKIQQVTEHAEDEHADSRRPGTAQV